MKQTNLLLVPASLIVVLAAIAAGVGVFYQDGGTAFPFTTLRGETVQIYGQGLYHYDTPLIAIGYRVIDAVILGLCIPALLISIRLYRRNSLRGGFLLAGTLAYFLYYYGSMALGAAYNNLFLVYIALMSLSLFSFVLALTCFDMQKLPSQFTGHFPRRGIGIYLVVSGLVVMLVWIGLSIVPALLAGAAPVEIGSYTTSITDVVDIGIIAPAFMLAGVLFLRRAPFGYLLAGVMLVLTVLLGTSLLAAGIAQMLAGLMSIGQFIGFTVSFAILTLCGIVFTVLLFRSIVGSAPLPAVEAQRDERNYMLAKGN